jgi:hypothetical protein
MKKFRILLVGIALTAITAGVFAGRPKFANDLYVSSDGTNFTKILSSAATFDELQTTANGSQVQIKDHAGNSFGLYFSNSAGAKLYSTNTW